MFPAFKSNIGVFWIFNDESSGNEAMQGTLKGYVYVVPIEETTEERHDTSLQTSEELAHRKGRRFSLCCFREQNENQWVQTEKRKEVPARCQKELLYCIISCGPIMPVPNIGLSVTHYVLLKTNKVGKMLVCQFSGFQMYP